MVDEVFEAADVAMELRRRLAGVGVKKLHKLLYYCQGHHLADGGRPLFAESIAAWDIGPVVGKLWKSEQAGPPATNVRALDDAALNTIGYVVSRYGALTDETRRSVSRRAAVGSCSPAWSIDSRPVTEIIS